MSAEQITISGDSDAYVVVKCTINNKSDVPLTLSDKSCQIKSKRATAAATSLAAGKSHEFTMSPHDELVYTTTLGEEAHFKIKFDDDDSAPKLKCGDAFDGKDTTLGVETRIVERKQETEEKFEEEITESRTTGEKMPEFKETKETEEESSTGNTKKEVKSKQKIEIEKLKKKQTTVRKTEIKKKDVECTWTIYKV